MKEFVSWLLTIVEVIADAASLETFVNIINTIVKYCKELRSKT